MKSSHASLRWLRWTLPVLTGLGIIISIYDRYSLEKFATNLVSPVGLVWCVMIAGILYSALTKQRTALQTLIVCWIAYSIAGNRIVANWMAVSLEQPYVSIAPFSQEPFDVIVVLGGGGSLGPNGRPQGDISGDRMILAAQMYHQKLTRKIICTGKLIESVDHSGMNPSAITQDVLVRLGVSSDDIEELPGKNTSEEMFELGKRFHQTKLRVGVITSAWHMHRAMTLASRNDFHPIPLPADYKSNPSRLFPKSMAEGIDFCVPTGTALFMNGIFAKEYLGHAIGR